MRKYILLIFLLAFTAGCGGRISQTERDFSKAPAGGTGVKTKTAFLLPLSGPNAAVGESFQNAALMAGLEWPGESAEVLFYDTKGTPEGTVEAYQKAQEDSPDVFVGPVFAADVRAVREQKPDKPIISFTSDTSVLGNGVYSVALLIPQQIQRIVEYACEQGQRRFALIGPKDKTGDIVVQAFENAVQSCPGMEIAHRSLYQPSSNDLTTPVVKIAPPLIDPRRKNLTRREKELIKNPSADRLSFDALFLFEQGIKLEQLVSILYYYDVLPQIVPFYGLATLRHTRNTQLAGAYFADVPQNRLNIFKTKYKEGFEKNALPVASFGYDAFSLVSFLSGKGALDEAALTDPLGFQGVNGRFRLNTDGTNDRLLEVFQIRSMGYIRQVSAAAADF